MEPADREYLLTIARDAVLATVRDLPLPELNGYPWPDPALRGAFVTLRRGARLHGCIGTFKPTAALPQTVSEMAAAAVHDPRSADRLLLPDEVPSLRIELSILSPLVRTHDPLGLEPGVHGIYIRAGSRTGCFLPHVATESGWNAEAFLSRCCEMKMHLDHDSWRAPDTEVFLFTAEHFASDG